ncbi:MAG TPA: hypothetical protein VLA83_15375 [Candidatus Binatia bacterium]|nr:hypothetical protein [Candidatus Binatia bacterium]
MKHNVMLTIASLFSILLLTFHLSGDIIRGMEKGGASNLIAIPILVVWLYGTLVLAERRSGYVIILLGSLLGLAIPVVHMKGAGLGAQVARAPSGGFFFVWTTIALGVTALFSVILAVRGLWNPQWGQSSSSAT